MVHVALERDFLITLWHSEQVKVSQLWEMISVSKLFIAGWWSGCSKSEFGMVIVADRLQQLRDPKPHFRRSLSLAQCCAFEMCYGVADSTGCTVVDGLEAFSAFAAQDLRVKDRVAVWALMAIGLAPLFLHHPGHNATTLVD